MKNILALVLAFIIVSCSESTTNTIVNMLDAATDGSVADAQVVPGNTSYSGSRLTMHAVVYNGTDGSRYDTGSVRVFDEQLLIECVRGLASDGSVRCIPDVQYATTVNEYYADASCTQRVALLPSGTLCGGFVRVQAATTCDAGHTISARVSVFRVTSYVLPTIYQKGASCNMVATPGGTFVRFDAEITPSEMVSLTEAP